MALIPYMKQVDIQKLEEEKKVEFGLSEWVNIQFSPSEVKGIDEELEGEEYEEDEIVEYECNRYDVTYVDEEVGVKLCLYVYMNENSDKIYAIDEVVKNDNEEIYYPTVETPFAKIFGI